MPDLTDKEQQDQGKVVKFGMDQFANPTPKLATTIQRIINGLVSAWGMMLLASPTLIPEHAQVGVNKWILLIPAITLFFKSAFGWDFPKSDNQKTT